MRPFSSLLCLLLLTSSLFSSSLSLSWFGSGIEGSRVLQSLGSNSGATSALQNDAQGFFDDYIVSWAVANLTENVVDMEILVRIVIRSGTLNSFPFNLMDTRFGDVIGGSGDVQAFRNNVPISGTLSVSDSGFYRFSVNLVPPATFGTHEIRYQYQVRNTICKLDGKIGIAGTWASLLQTSTNNIEYDYSVPINVKDLGGDLFFKPNGANTKSFTDSLSSVFVSYSDSDLSLGQTTPAEVFFTWEPNDIFDPEQDVGKCTRIQQDFLFIYILASIPAAACVCLLFMAILQRYTDTGARFERATGLDRLRLGHFFPGNRDIVLSPTSNETTVRAQYENEEDLELLDQMVPITTINVEIDEYHSGAEGSTVNNESTVAGNADNNDESILHPELAAQNEEVSNADKSKRRDNLDEGNSGISL